MSSAASDEIAFTEEGHDDDQRGHGRQGRYEKDAFQAPLKEDEPCQEGPRRLSEPEDHGVGGEESASVLGAAERDEEAQKGGHVQPLGDAEEGGRSEDERVAFGAGVEGQGKSEEAEGQAEAYPRGHPGGDEAGTGGREGRRQGLAEEDEADRKGSGSEAFGQEKGKVRRHGPEQDEEGPRRRRQDGDDLPLSKALPKRPEVAAHRGGVPFRGGLEAEGDGEGDR